MRSRSVFRIHGEPGRERAKIKSADEIVDLLLDGVVPDLPYAAGDRVALMINGLGGTPITGLSVLFRRAHQQLAAKGSSVAPQLRQRVLHCDSIGTRWRGRDTGFGWVRGRAMPQERVGVVTGGGSGIGRSAALALAADGWTVLLVGRRVEALESVVAEGADLSGRLVARPADVTDESAVVGVFDGAVADFGRVDLLFNNAGMFAPSRDIDEIPLAEWTGVVAVNLTGAFLCAREAFRVMRNQDPKGGRIINNGSISAQTPRVKAVAYTATKHAIAGLTKSLALDGRPYGIACGQIDVGNAATELTARWDDGTLQPSGAVVVEPKMDVRDVGRTVAFMASLPLDANVLTMTVMATTMPFVGRG